MRVFITGGTGYVGQAIVNACAAAGHQVQLLVRPGSEHKLPQSIRESANVAFMYGDVLQASTLAAAMQDCDAVIHLVGIIREFPRRGITFDKLHIEAARNVVQTAESLGIKRYIHMSALGARIGSHSGYSHSKGVAEQIVTGSSLAWTIFRPSVIFGPNDEFVNMLAGMIRTTPVVPVIGSGSYRLQPVALANVAEGFAKALLRPETAGKIYEVGGPYSYSYDEMIDEIAAALGKKRLHFHAPLWLMQPVIKVMQGFSFFPITQPQLQMLLEGNTCDPTAFINEFQVELVPFDKGIQEYLS